MGRGSRVTPGMSPGHEAPRADLEEDSGLSDMLGAGTHSARKLKQGAQNKVASALANFSPKSVVCPNFFHTSD